MRSAMHACTGSNGLLKTFAFCRCCSSIELLWSRDGRLYADVFRKPMLNRRQQMGTSSIGRKHRGID
ncbi:hypothetical protein WMY93_013453 [Mugilogobius chulae]|uniref:Uncharacterized protein n=1 Tax=Mugilogobius chulae TaxID=88201 RepID=A0AAW0P413_9GOBI